LTTLTQRISGFPKNRVIGTGTSLDTARLRVALAKRCHVPVREISVDVLGEHGDTSFANFDEATIAGKPLKEFADVSDEELAEMQSGVKKKGWRDYSFQRCNLLWRCPLSVFDLRGHHLQSFNRFAIIGAFEWSVWHQGSVLRDASFR
jgi:hypothetical protein